MQKTGEMETNYDKGNTTYHNNLIDKFILEIDLYLLCIFSQAIQTTVQTETTEEVDPFS